MPEIAEVRTVAKTLNKALKDKKIIDIEILFPKIIKTDKEEFINIIRGKSFKSVKSIGKWLIFDLGEYSFLSHLRMEGKYFIKEKDEKVEKHEHVIFHLEDKDLRYHDVRKFGVMLLSKSKDVLNLKEISKLGIEPDSDKLTLNYLKAHLNKNKFIKELLLNQEIINGLGNIYVDEILFLSGIHPERLGNSLNDEEVTEIIKYSKEVIEKATLYKGTTIRSYTSSLGVRGEYQQFLNVHTKAGENCPKCSSTILKTRVAGRGTYYCPSCQRNNKIN